MTIDNSTCLWQIQEPPTSYSSDDQQHFTIKVKVQSTGYPPLKSNPGLCGCRRIPWINLRGFWLEHAGFEIGVRYTIEVYDRRLVFRVVD